MDVSMRAQLLEKTVLIDGKEQNVYGLARFRTRPSRYGIGTHCLRAFEGITKRDGKYCIVGSCDDERTLQFYLKAGYYAQGKFEGKWLFTSVPVKSLTVTENW